MKSRCHCRTLSGSLIAVSLLDAGVAIARCLAAPTPATAKFITLDVPNTPGETQARRINDSGQIVGLCGDIANHAKGFLLSHGKYSIVKLSGLPDCALASVSINNQGEIAGAFSDIWNQRHAFLISRGKFAEFASPGNGNFHVFDLNSKGQIVGSYDNGSDTTGFLLEQGVYKTIRFPKADVVNILGISDNGRMVGEFAEKRNAHGFLLINGVRMLIDYPKATTTMPLGVNDQGDVVGNYFLSNQNGHGRGFLWRRGKFTAISAPGGAKGITAFDINNRGQIVGFYQDSKGKTRGFLRSP